MYRRNFTFGLASPMSDSDGAAWAPGTGPAESWTLMDEQFPVGTDGQDVNSIACAVNTFGQNDIYGYVYNGLCFRGGYTASSFGKSCRRAQFRVQRTDDTFDRISCASEL